MGIFQIAMTVATLLCSMVAGFLFAFAVVVMPGIRTLKDGEFIRAFQVMDGIIQNNQPLFLLMWVGSVVALIAAVALGLTTGQPEGADRPLILIAALVYLLGVQVPTVTINIPLNNRLQALDVDAADEAMRKAARERFEPRWNRWNSIRTVFAVLASALLIVSLLGSVTQ